MMGLERAFLQALQVARARAVVLQHLRLLEGYETALHHIVQDRQERLDLLFRIDDFDDPRQIGAQREEMRLMQAG
jgi:hypothetical protein